jgi:hypothetical protein
MEFPFVWRKVEIRSGMIQRGSSYISSIPGGSEKSEKALEYPEKMGKGRTKPGLFFWTLPRVISGLIYVKMRASFYILGISCKVNRLFFTLQL